MFSILFAVICLTIDPTPLEIEEEELALSEQSAIIEDDMAQDGELVFDDQEPVAELEENE